MAVALHLRGDGLISGASAAWIWQLIDSRPDMIAATIVGRGAHPMSGVALHRVAHLHPADVRWRHGIPVTSPARSLCDAAGQVTLPEAESGLARLRRQSARADEQIREVLSRLPANHPGAARVRRLMALAPGEVSLTRSHYERLLKRLLREAGLPNPLANQMVAGHERDFIWPQAKLILEFDGWEFHRDRFEADRRRDAAAVAAGWRVIRITARRLDEEPLMVIAEIAAALALSTAA